MTTIMAIERVSIGDVVHDVAIPGGQGRVLGMVDGDGGYDLEINAVDLATSTIEQGTLHVAAGTPVVVTRQVSWEVDWPDGENPEQPVVTYGGSYVEVPGSDVQHRIRDTTNPMAEWANGAVTLGIYRTVCGVRLQGIPSHEPNPQDLRPCRRCNP